jgi:hypothetical protein
VEIELVGVRLHALDGDDRGTAELPVGWTLEVGNLLVDDAGQLVRVVDLIPVAPPAAIAATALDAVSRQPFQADLAEVRLTAKAACNFTERPEVTATSTRRRRDGGAARPHAHRCGII